MSLTTVDNLIGNTYGTGGTNKPSGFKAGDFMIPGQVNRGVTITNTFPSQLIVLPEIVIFTYTFTADSPLIVSLNLMNSLAPSLTPIVNFTSRELALLLLAPTRVSASANNQPYNMIVSGYDQYEQKTVSVQASSGVGNIAVTNVCYNYLSNITLSLNTPLSGDQTNTVTIQIGGNVELPYTDYGNENFLLNVINAQTFVPYVTMDGPEADYTPTYAFLYTPANWNTPITASTGSPRPVIFPIETSTTNIILMSQQVIYPTNNFPSLKAAPIAFSEDNLTNVIGIKNYTQGWLPWDGGNI